MPKYRDDLDIKDLARLTLFMHKIKEWTKDFVVIAVEEIQESDQNVAFLLSNSSLPEGEQEETVLVSADYVANFNSKPG